MIQSQDPSRTLATAETWLKQKPNNAVLLTSLGKLSLRAQLWGKAKKYLEQSIEQQPSPEAYYYLGQAYNELGHSIQAKEVYYKGLVNEVKPRNKHDLVED